MPRRSGPRAAPCVFSLIRANRKVATIINGIVWSFFICIPEPPGLFFHTGFYRIVNHKQAKDKSAWPNDQVSDQKGPEIFLFLKLLRKRGTLLRLEKYDYIVIEKTSALKETNIESEHKKLGRGSLLVATAPRFYRCSLLNLSCNKMLILKYRYWVDSLKKWNYCCLFFKISDNCLMFFQQLSISNYKSAYV